MSTSTHGQDVTTPQEAATTSVVPEVLTDEHHEAITRAWEMPTVEHPTEPPMTSEKTSRTWLVALLAGLLGLVLGFAGGWFAQSQTTQAPAFEITALNGYSWAHDSAIVEPINPRLGYSWVHDGHWPAPVAPGYSATHDSRII